MSDKKKEDYSSYKKKKEKYKHDSRTCITPQYCDFVKNVCISCGKLK